MQYQIKENLIAERIESITYISLYIILVDLTQHHSLQTYSYFPKAWNSKESYNNISVQQLCDCSFFIKQFPWVLCFLDSSFSLQSFPYLITQYPILYCPQTQRAPSPLFLSRRPWLIFILPPQRPGVPQVHFIREKANGYLAKNMFQVNAHWGNRQATWRNQIYLSHCLLIPKSNSLHRLYHPSYNCSCFTLLASAFLYPLPS